MFYKIRKKVLFSALITLLLLLFLFQSQGYRIKSKIEISDEWKEKLSLLGQEALNSKDIPVAALVVYDGLIIGRGYNTVYRDGNLSGHAEINALNDAFGKYGDDFLALDRDKLVLYSTFEPCEMCKGAMVHYGIEQVYFEKTKPAFHQVKSTLKQLEYEWLKRRIDAKNLQENLFIQHPEYQYQK